MNKILTISALSVIIAANSGCLGIGGLNKKIDNIQASIEESDKINKSDRSTINGINDQINAINSKIDKKIINIQEATDDTLKALGKALEALDKDINANNLVITKNQTALDANMVNIGTALTAKIEAINALILKEQEVVFDMDAFWVAVEKYELTADTDINKTAYEALKALEDLVDKDGTKAFKYITDNATDGGIIGIAKTALTDDNGTVLTFTPQASGQKLTDETAAGKKSSLKALKAKIATAKTTSATEHSKFLKAKEQLQTISNTLDELSTVEMDKLVITYLNKAFALTNHTVPTFTAETIGELKSLTDLLHKYYVEGTKLVDDDGKLTITNPSLSKAYNIIKKAIPKPEAEPK